MLGLRDLCNGRLNLFLLRILNDLLGIGTSVCLLTAGLLFAAFNNFLSGWASCNAFRLVKRSDRHWQFAMELGRVRILLWGVHDGLTFFSFGYECVCGLLFTLDCRDELRRLRG